MSPDKPTSALTNPRRRILRLVVVHVLAVVMGIFMAHFAGRSPTLRGAVFLGIVSSQTSLLGIWGGLGADPWWKRLIGVEVGVGYLGLFLSLGTDALEGFGVAFLTTTFVTLPLLIVRFFKVAIRRDSFPVATVGRIQFSIRHLMILTSVVACLLTIGKGVQAYHFPPVPRLLALLLDAVMVGLVGVFPVWLVLATKHPVMYSIGLVAVGTCAGYSVTQITYPHLDVIWMTVMATEAMAVVVSLLVVRSCGYRLVRLASHHQEEH